MQIRKLKCVRYKMVYFVKMLLKLFTDQLNRTIEVRFPPARIVSLVPSQTELLADLGLNNEVIGITRYCVHPDYWFRTKTRVGGTKKLDLEKIKSLQPDLIIGNKEENVQSQIDELSRSFPMWISDIENLNDALQMIHSVGQLVNREYEADAIASKIESNFSILKHSESALRIRVAYIIWRNPVMTIGADTFINSIMQHCGLENVFKDKKRYPEITNRELSQARPQVILLSSEPYPFREKHVQEFSEICPDAKIMLADGQMFSWYGSRLIKAADYLRKLKLEIISDVSV